MIRPTSLVIFATLLLSFTAQLPATTIFTFSGLQDGEQVLGFYGGGSGSQGSTNFNYGVTFTAGSVSLIDSDVGGSGNFANAPSPFGVLFSTTGSLSFNVSPGFVEALTFYYVTHTNAASGTVRIFDGLNGTGAQLGSATLNPVNQICPGDPQGGFYGCWQPVTITFAGAGRSVVFQVPVLEMAIDNIGLNLPAIESIYTLPLATPEPSTLVLMGSALAGAWILRNRLRG